MASVVLPDLETAETGFPLMGVVLNGRLGQKGLFFEGTFLGGILTINFTESFISQKQLIFINGAGVENEQICLHNKMGFFDEYA